MVAQCTHSGSLLGKFLIECDFCSCSLYSWDPAVCFCLAAAGLLKPVLVLIVGGTDNSNKWMTAEGQQNGISTTGQMYYLYN